MNAAKSSGPRSAMAASMAAAVRSLMGPVSPGSAGTWENPAVTEREIRKAAALIAVRDASTGPEVLVIERSAASRFLPGYISFPGGRTDEEDSELARRWFGDRAEAARATAVRELLEEVGLALTLDGLRTAPHDDATAIDAAPPHAETLREI